MIVNKKIRNILISLMAVILIIGTVTLVSNTSASRIKPKFIVELDTHEVETDG